eukprot:8484327-Pyramimonas_sp.AAC.1
MVTSSFLAVARSSRSELRAASTSLERRFTSLPRVARVELNPELSPEYLRARAANVSQPRP